MKSSIKKIVILSARLIGALNYLTHNFPEELTEKCPILKDEISYREPGSFWIMRN